MMNKTRIDKRVKELAKEMDFAIEAVDKNGFMRAFGVAGDYMRKAKRAEYFQRFKDAYRNRE